MVTPLYENEAPAPGHRSKNDMDLVYLAPEAPEPDCDIYRE